MKICAKWVGSVVLMGVVAAGCARKDAVEAPEATPEATAEIVPIQERVAAVEQASGLLAALLQGIGHLLVLEDAQQRQELFAWLLERAVAADDTETVVKFVYALVEHDAQLAGQALHLLDATMMERDPIRWMAYLQADVLPPAFRIHGYGLWFRHYGGEATDLELASTLLTLQDPILQGYTEGLFQDALSAVLRHEDPERIWSVLEILRNAIAPESGLRPYFLQIEGQALLRDERLEDAIAHYRTHATSFGDARISRVMSDLLQQAALRERADLVAELRAWGYTLEAFPMSRNRVARWDLEQLRGEQDVLAMVDGVGEILAQGIPVQVVSASFLGNMLYPALARARQEELLALRDLVLEMEAGASEASEPVRSGLGSALLDVYFYLEDFAGALARIEQGVAGFDTEWHAELHDKVQAHLAQAEGRAADAVGFYAAHIERVRGWEAPLTSPEDGRQIVPDEVIALNERRIGGIWAGEGEHEKAAAAYVRARAHYRTALDQYRDDELSHATVAQALAELEGTMP